MSFGDLQLESSLIQNGISIDASGKQTLGVPSLQPIMLLDKSDFSLQPGVTGKSMICSNHDHFPTVGIKSPITYQGHTSYFYYNTIMKAYYVMEVDGADIRYISMAGGNIYNVDGSLRAVSNPVAIKMVNDVADATDMLLPYLNGNSYTQCLMINQNNKGLYSEFVNVEKSFKGGMKLGTTLAALNLLVAAADPYNQVNVVQMPRPATIPPMPNINLATQYNVYWDDKNPTIYKVDASYKAQNLTLLPLNMKNRSMMNPMPSSAFKNARLVLKQGIVEHLLFANNLYEVSASDGAVYKMKQVGNGTAAGLTVSLKTDMQTNVNYYEIVAGQTTYNYQITFDMLSDEQLTSYRYNAWKSETVADVTAKIILVQFLPRTASGQVQLSEVDLASVQNLSTDAANKAIMATNLNRVKKDTTHGRFVASIFKSGGTDDQAPFYAYFDQNGYVDLETGALFDEKGVPVGGTLTITDLVALLNKFAVSVTRDKKQQAVLVSSLPRKDGGSSATTKKTRTVATNVGTIATGKAKVLDFKSQLSQAQKEKIAQVKSKMTQAQSDKIAKLKDRVGQTSLDQKQANIKDKISQMSDADKSNIKAKMNLTADEKKAAAQSKLSQSQQDKIASAKSKMTQTQADKIAGIKSQLGQTLAAKASSLNDQQDQAVAAAAAHESGVLGKLSSANSDDVVDRVVIQSQSGTKFSGADRIKELQTTNKHLERSIDRAQKKIEFLESRNHSNYIDNRIAAKNSLIVNNQKTMNKNNALISLLQAAQ